MTISTWLMILTLAVGAGTTQSLESDSTTDPSSNIRTGKIAGNCWINGTWYNPCPEPAPDPYPVPEKSPEILIPL